VCHDMPDDLRRPVPYKLTMTATRPPLPDSALTELFDSCRIVAVEPASTFRPTPSY